MRNLGICFLVFMVLLSILPCSDELDAPVAAGDAISMVSQRGDDGATESCSPLCLCACCGQQVVAPSQLYLTTPIAKTKAKRIAIIQNLAPQKRAFGIWQPPKLV